MNSGSVITLVCLTSAIVVLAIVGAVASVYIVIRPNSVPADFQPLLIIGAILGFLTPTITSFLGMAKSYQNNDDIKELKGQTNGLTTHLVEQARQNATLVERAAGVEKAQEVKDVRDAKEAATASSEVASDAARNISAL